MVEILITGKNSFIGTSLKKWVNSKPSYFLDSIDMKNESWREESFSKYDVVFHVAGIAHVSANPKMEDLYYKVNRDLTIDAAKKAKAEGVNQFIFMSSIIVYGDSTEKKRVITETTLPNPSNFYGDSKLQAEKGIKELESEDFKVAIIRPPMIYGKGAKGNYSMLSKLANKTPIFPDFKNERSMLHIDNLCEFIKALIDNQDSGLFFPQNEEYVNTADMVALIADVNGKKVRKTKLFNFLIKRLFRFQMVNKAFGNLVYEKSLSEYEKHNYRIRSFEKSIEVTELGGR